VPPGAQVVEASGPGPFVTRARYRLADGRLVEWTSRAHRKRRGHHRLWWEPARLGWWVAALFVVGSACFAVGSLPGYSKAVGQAADGITYFVGSIFFTSASYLQFVQCINADPTAGGSDHWRGRLAALEPRRIDWWATAIQLAGTLFFNVTTFTALADGLTAKQENLVVWTPDALGSICFLVSSELAFAEAGHRWLSWLPHDLGWRIAAINLLGSVFFGVSAIAGYVVPATGDVLNAALDTAGTFLGALCFLAGALLLFPEAAAEP
jgi:hypothetical protein